MRSKAEIKKLIEDNNVKFIRLEFVDIFGQAKNVATTLNDIDKVLNNEMMFDGSSVDGFARIEESDMFLYPDLDSFTILPWESERGSEAKIICNVYKTDGTPFLGCPRNILIRAIEDAKQLGYSFKIGPECEFFLFNRGEHGEPTTETNDKAGYFDLGHLDNGEKFRRNASLILEDMGFLIEASHHECGDGQHEIDFKYDEALKTADRIMTFRQVIKRLAKEEGLHATFMPKPLYGKHGSGMHINMSLTKNDKNIFFDKTEEDGLSEEAYYFIGGILKYAKDFTSITNPLVNSYKRLVPGYEAPCYIAWSNKNRSPLVRIPASRGEGTRVELRNPDPSANPYLVLASCLKAGTRGIKEKITPPKPIEANIYELTSKEKEEYGITQLPRSLREAIEITEKSEFMKEVLGSHTHGIYVKAKKKEHLDYVMRVTKWEIENYLTSF